MNDDNDRNSESDGSWILILFIMAIPIMGIMALALFIGMGGSLMERLRSWTHKA